MNSMTGYGKAEYTENEVFITVEVKSVNNKNLDISVKIPKSFFCFDDMIRKAVQMKVQRGKVDVYIAFTDARKREVTLFADYPLAKAYCAAAAELSAGLGVENDLTVSRLMKIPDVIKDRDNSEPDDFIKGAISDALGRALDNFNEMRKTEGEKLKADMLNRLADVAQTVSEIQKFAPSVAEEYRQKLQKRIAEQLENVSFDESRLLSEVAFFVDKSNIDEEIARLNSHVAQFERITQNAGEGKKLDFLMQEFIREANTICSKANNISVTNLGLKLKNDIEKIREQVQNVE